MKFTLTLDPKYKETRLDVTAPELTTEIEELQTYLAGKTTTPLLAYAQGSAIPLSLSQTLRFFTSDKNVYAHTAKGTWQVKQRMKELEARLPQSFIRINQGELINIHWVERFDVSLTTTIGVVLKDGTRCFVSRRSLTNVKQALGL
ncbi:MAG: LytTR family DNA-binding domain-containing protein [Rothia sp. (in: high G+C Gram-positive bacteria)]|nr:LytTR family DNA-binding domain-containing protein [Rothia sp. (in: high G+C Gram-positive bacteria)]